MLWFKPPCVVVCHRACTLWSPVTSVGRRSILDLQRTIRSGAHCVEDLIQFRGNGIVVKNLREIALCSEPSNLVKQDDERVSSGRRG